MESLVKIVMCVPTTQLVMKKKVRWQFQFFFALHSVALAKDVAAIIVAARPTEDQLEVS